MPFHLLLPLCASILFVLGLMFNKRATQAGATAWNIAFVANWWAALLFSTLLLREAGPQPWELFYQPIVIGILYVLGQTFTFLALERGDVSVATPILSAKVIGVAFLATWLAGDAVSGVIWLGAVLATVGIVFVQSSGTTESHSRVLFTVLFSVLGASTFALFDVVIQMWAQVWSPNRLLPYSFAFAAILSLGFLPFMDLRAYRKRAVMNHLLPGTLMIGMQAMCIVFAIGTFGDVARINIVYALRALWGVVLAWSLAKVFQGAEGHLPNSVMLKRLVGAALLTIAVIFALVY